tara:strand:+ start:112 stop:309 length:198 start_codon:yes stop_codon:yes gene_type:complete
MTDNLINPTNETWFICWNGDRSEIKAYGSIGTNQSFKTAWTEVDFFTNEVTWNTLLVANNINLLD